MTAIDALINRLNGQLKEPYQQSKVYRLLRESGTSTPFEWAKQELQKIGKPYTWGDIQHKLDDWKELHGYPRYMGMTLEDAGLAYHQTENFDITHEEFDNFYLKFKLMASMKLEKLHIESMKSYPSRVAHYFSYEFSQRKKEFIADLLPFSFKEKDKNIVYHPLFKETTESEAIQLLGWHNNPEMYAQYLEGKKYWLKDDIKRYANTNPLIEQPLRKQLYQLEKSPARLANALAAIRGKRRTEKSVSK